MEQICPKMNGEKCAGSFCDLWCTVEKRCLHAVSKDKEIEVLDIIKREISLPRGNRKLKKVIKKNVKKVLH